MKKRYWWILAISIATIFIGCYSWLACRSVCIATIKENSSYLISTGMFYGKKILLLILIFIIFKVIKSVLIERAFMRIAKNLQSPERTVSLRKILLFFLWSSFFIIALSVLFGNITTLLTSVGLVGFGLTFALQKPILNFVGWLTILFKNTYTEGDRIKIGSIIGDVKEIQVMNTILDGLLETSDIHSGKVISFPNELVLSTDVQNYTKNHNYIVNELAVTVTYESNYHKAAKLLEEIVTHLLTKNKHKYKKKLLQQQQELNSLVKGWITSKKKEITQIKKEQEELKEELKVLEEEFIPQIRVEMLDSSIKIIVQFKSPYDEIKKYRTAINLGFLDRIQQEDDIEIAYPHLKLVK